MCFRCGDLRVTTLPFSSCWTQRRFLLSCIHTKCDAATNEGLHVDCVVLVSDRRDTLLAAAAWHGLLSTSGTKFKASSLQPKSSLSAPTTVATISQGSQCKWTGKRCILLWASNLRLQSHTATLAVAHCRLQQRQHYNVTAPTFYSAPLIFMVTFLPPILSSFHFVFFPPLLPVWLTWLVDVLCVFFYSKETSFVCDKAAGGKKAQLRQERFYIKAQTAVVLID